MTRGLQFRRLFEANLKMMFREKQVWFWNIFFPIILMTIFMLIFGGDNEEFKAKVAVVQPVQNAAADGMLAGLKQIPVFEWKSEEPVSAEQADAWIKDKVVDGVIYLPEDGQVQSIKLVVNTENEQNATTQVLRGILDQFVMQANLAAAGVTEPAFRLEMDSVTSSTEELNYKDFLMTGMIGMALAQGGLFGMVDLVEMRRKGLLKRLRMTPMRMGLLGLSSMTVRFILGVFQVVCLAAIGVFGFGAQLHIDVPTLLVAFFIGCLAFNAIGYLISSISKSIEAYMGFANTANFLMMFISGIFFPVNGLPEWLQHVSNVLPLVYYVEGMRDGLVYGSGIGNPDFWIGAGVLALWGAAAYLIAATIYRKTKVEAR